MKIALAMILCSTLYKECLEPFTMPERFNTRYDCLLAGYEESQKKLKEIGREDINKYQTIIKFVCYDIREKPNA
jgi:hypothetical protein